MAVTEVDVRRIALLARLGLPSDVAGLVGQLNGILGHMEVLARAKTKEVEPTDGVGTGGTPLRTDDGPQIPLQRDRDEFAPATRDGFFLVPRLATHEALAGESSSASSSGTGSAVDEDAA